MKMYFLWILFLWVIISCGQKEEKNPYIPVSTFDAATQISDNKNSQDSIIWYTDLESLPANLDLVTHLSLREKGYDEIPAVIFKFKNLKTLDLSLHNISAIPEEISRLSQLESLTMAYGHLESIPPSIAKLKKLKELNFLYNDLKSLPESIGELDELEELNMNGNPISVIPETLFNIQGLKFLGLKQPGEASLFSASKQEEIRRRLPNCTVKFY
ncbi:MAG: leucine-rich repeat domain-containing protein [Bacteroidota bacterium]